MHHCFEIQEILSIIFNFILNDEKNADRRSGALGALVKTCRSFHDLGIPMLWQNLYNLAPLLLTLPEDLWELEKADRSTPFNPRTLTFKRPAESNDWGRFDMYAQFVKHIGTTSGLAQRWVQYVIVDHGVCEAMERRGTVLLPNLQTIVASSNDLRTTPMILNSDIAKIHLFMHPASHDALVRIAQSIPVYTPALKILNLSQSISWKPAQTWKIVPDLATMLSDLDLEQFHCPWISLTDAMAEYLLRMPSLREVSISKDLANLAEIFLTRPIGRPKIKNFIVSTSSSTVASSDVEAILQKLDGHSLESLIIRKTEGAIKCSIPELESIFTAIKTYCSPSQFREFRLNGHMERDDLDRPQIITFPVMRPLLQFSLLRSLEFSAHPLDLTDEEMKKAAVAWPNLEHFTFNDNCGNLSSEPRTTLRSLLWLATHCRKLESLSLQFTGSDVTFSGEELDQAANNGLRYLAVGRSMIDDASQVSSFISKAFPDLTILTWDQREGPESELHNERWEEVQTQIQQT